MQLNYLVWNAKSPKLALLIDHRFKLILDFESESILSNLQSLGSQMNWKPIRLDSQPKILDEFEEERLRIQNEELSQLIKGFQEDPSHYQRLKLFRSIMTSSFLIPISEPETDPAHMFLTFPKDQHQLLCTFTDVEAAKQNLGDELHFKRVPAQFLFNVLPSYNVDAVLITTSLGNNTLVAADDFELLGVLGSKSKQSYSEMAALLGQFLLNEANVSEGLLDLLRDAMSPLDIIQKAYVYESGSQVGTVTVGLVVDQSNDSKIGQFYRSLIGKTKVHLGEYQHLEIGILDDTKKTLLIALESNLSPIYEKS